MNDLIKQEKDRQVRGLELIASEVWSSTKIIQLISDVHDTMVSSRAEHQANWEAVRMILLTCFGNLGNVFVIKNSVQNVCRPKSTCCRPLESILINESLVWYQLRDNDKLIVTFTDQLHSRQLWISWVIAGIHFIPPLRCREAWSPHG